MLKLFKMLPFFLSSRRAWLIPGAALAAGLAISSVLAVRQEAANMRIAEESFSREGNDFVESLKTRIISYGHGLRGARGFFIGDPAADRVKFRHYVESRDLAKEFPGAMGIGFVRHVPRDRLAEFVQQRRRELGPDYKIRTMGANTGAAFVIDYFEPSLLGERVIGMDIGSEGARREAAMRAMWMGEEKISMPIFHTPLGGASAGFAYVLPVYRTGAPVATPLEREEAIFGWILMPLSMKGVFHSIANDQVDFELYDLVDDNEPQFIFGNTPHRAGMDGASASGKPRDLRKAYDLKIGGRSWRLHVSASPKFWASHNFAAPWATMAVGSLVSLLLAAVLWLLSMTGQRAQALAERMTESLRLRGQMLDSLGEGVYTADAQGNFTYFNPAALSMLGFDEAELIGRNQHLAFHHHYPDGRPYPQEECPLSKALKDGLIRSGEEWFFRKDGSGFPVRYTCAPLVLGDKLSGVVMVFRNIAEQKQNEKSLHDAKEAAEAASRAKSEFLASMSHELRTPLNAILGFSQLLGMDMDLTEDTRDQIREIEHAGEHLLSLISDLIDLARIEAGKLELSPEPVPVKAVLAESLALVAPIARKQGIELTEADGHCNVDQVAVRADHVRLRQVVINLLSNAIKYNRPQGSVRLSCSLGDGKARISVADTGPGIPAGKQGRIFNAFDRLGVEGGPIEGTGIGLVITKRIVEAMGGSIGFESAEGRGSTFWVEFPVVAPTEFSALEGTAPVAESAAASPQTTRPVVLYVEDNPMNLRLMQQIFAMRKDLELRDAPTAEMGIELARAEPPALILMDINLPGMDGYAALSVLKSDPRTARIPVIAITANAMKDDAELGLKSGFADYLTKPLDISQLWTQINTLLQPGMEKGRPV